MVSSTYLSQSDGGFLADSRASFSKYSIYKFATIGDTGPHGCSLLLLEVLSSVNKICAIKTQF